MFHHHRIPGTTKACVRQKHINTEANISQSFIVNHLHNATFKGEQYIFESAKNKWMRDVAVQQQQCGNCSSSSQKCSSSETVIQDTGRHLRHVTYRLCCHSGSNYTFPPIGLSLKSNKTSVKGILAPGKEVLSQASPRYRGNSGGNPKPHSGLTWAGGSANCVYQSHKNMHTFALVK